METRKDHKELSDLLKQKDRSQLDDFEKEALEGFDLLSTDEAFQLKNELDKEIGQKVFMPKKQNTRVFILAAASLVLVVGLSVLFVLNNSGLEDKTGLAIHTKTEETNLPEAVKSSPVPTEPSADVLQEKNKERGSKEPLGNTNAEQAPKAETKELEGKPVRVASDPNASGLAQNIKDEVAEEAKESTILDDIRNDNAKGGAEELKKANTKATDREQTPMEDKKSENNKDQLNSIARSAPASGSGEVELSKPSKEKSRKKSRSSSAGKLDAQPSQKQEEDADASVAESRNESEKLEEKYSAPSAPSVETTSGKNAGPGNVSAAYTYKSGEKELMKDLSIQLKREELNVSFDADLFINKKGKVEKVNVYNAKDLSNKKINSLEKILKDLEPFSVPKNASGLYKYQLHYQP